MENQPKSGNELALTIPEAERALKLSHTKIYEEIMSGRLRSYKFGKRRYTTRDWCQDWIASRAADTQTQAA